MLELFPFPYYRKQAFTMQNADKLILFDIYNYRKPRSDRLYQAIFQLYRCIRWNGDEVRFVSDQHAYLDIYSASALK